MNSKQFNFIAMGACFVLLHVLGFLWYGPLFQTPWMEMSGITMEEIQAEQGNIGMWIDR